MRWLNGIDSDLTQSESRKNRLTRCDGRAHREERRADAISDCENVELGPMGKQRSELGRQEADGWAWVLCRSR